MAFLAVGILVIHFYFLSMILKANKLDKQQSWYYVKALNELLHTDYEMQQDPHSQELHLLITEFRASPWRMKGYWACFVQMGITFLLLVAMFLVLKEKLPI